ncbi:PREDICTED: uncharacterized protein LOC102251302, partial [Myotis brandtii]|uniref:uncharacterized protein LOC102251302 n=1 Tax=Myotis brandtii TaxID=109478 RepID=UPI0007040067
MSMPVWEQRCGRRGDPRVSPFPRFHPWPLVPTTPEPGPPVLIFPLSFRGPDGAVGLEERLLRAGVPTPPGSLLVPGAPGQRDCASRRERPTSPSCGSSDPEKCQVDPPFHLDQKLDLVNAAVACVFSLPLIVPSQNRKESASLYLQTVQALDDMLQALVMDGRDPNMAMLQRMLEIILPWLTMSEKEQEQSRAAYTTSHLLRFTCNFPELLVPEMVKFIYHNMNSITEATAQETMRKVLQLLAQAYADDVILTLLQMQDQSHRGNRKPWEILASIPQSYVAIMEHLLRRLTVHLKHRAPEASDRTQISPLITRQLGLLQPYVLNCCHSEDGEVVTETFLVLRCLVEHLPWQKFPSFLVQLAFTLGPFFEAESEPLRLKAFEIYGALLAKVKRSFLVSPLKHQVLNSLVLLVAHLADRDAR